MRKVPRNYKSQRFGDSNAFETIHFWRPINRIVDAIDRTIIDDQEKLEAKKLVLQLPYFKGSTPPEILNLNEFPYNFPHLYLWRLSNVLESFEGSTVRELQARIISWKEKIEKKDVYHYLNRWPGSYETGRR